MWLVGVAVVLGLVGAAACGWGGGMTAGTYGDQPVRDDITPPGTFSAAAVACLLAPPLLAWPLLGWRAALVTVGVEAVVVLLVLSQVAGT